MSDTATTEAPAPGQPEEPKPSLRAQARDAYRQLPRPAQAGVVAGGVLVAWVLAAALLPQGAPLEIVLQGVVLGTVTALLGMGLILIYKTNHIINFAYASMGGVGAVLAVHLFLISEWPYPAAIVVGLLTGLVVGAMVELVVIRRFERASRLILTVATIGLAQVLGAIELLIPAWFGGSGLIGGFETPLSQYGTNIGVVYFNGNHMLIVAAVPVVIAALAWFLLKTDAGVAVRAAAENRDRAVLLGIPIQRLTTIVWIVAGGLAALTAILKAPFAGSVSTALGGPTLLLPALAAAVLAKMESLPRAFVAGIALGILEQVVFWNTARASTIDLAFFLVILIGLLLQRGTLSRAEDSGGGAWSMAEAVRAIPTELRALPEVRFVKYGLLAAVAVLALWLPTTWSISSINMATFALIWGIVAISLVVLTGWGGNISLGQFAFVGVGAMVAANVAVRWNIDLFVTLAIAGVVGGIVALLVGLPALRIRGLFLAVTTLAFAVALDSYFLNPTNFPGLMQGTVRRPSLWQQYDLHEARLGMYFLCLAFLVLTILVVQAVRSTRSGRVLIATRDNTRAAAASGVPTTAVRLMGFVFSGVLAGIAGGLYVFQLQGVRAGQFMPTLSLEVFSMAVIGGMGSVTGALIGVFSLRWLSSVLSGELRLIVTGAGLLFILMALPGGLAQPLFALRDRYLRRIAARRGIHVPSLLEDRRIEEGAEHPEDETAVLAGALADAPSDGGRTEREVETR